MASRLTVIFYIVLCFEAGVFLTVLPWVGGGAYWGDNYFLVLATQKIGAVGLQRAVASGWVRGAVTGLGLLNIAMAFWELFHFYDAVRRLQDSGDRKPAATLPDAPHIHASLPTNEAHEGDAARTPQADHVSHHGRRDQ